MHLREGETRVIRALANLREHETRMFRPLARVREHETCMFLCFWGSRAVFFLREGQQWKPRSPDFSSGRGVGNGWPDRRARPLYSVKPLNDEIQRLVVLLLLTAKGGGLKELGAFYFFLWAEVDF